MTDYFWIKAVLERTISATYAVVNPVNRNRGLLCPPIIVDEATLYDDTEVMEATDEEWEEERSKLFEDLKAKKSRVDELEDENDELRKSLQASRDVNEPEINRGVLTGRIDTSSPSQGVEPRADLAQENARLTEDLEALRIRAAAAKKRADELDRENDTLQDRISTLEEGLEGTKLRVGAVLDENDDLRKELEELRSQALTSTKPAAVGSSVATGDQFLKERLDIANATISRLIEAGKTMHKNIELTDAEYHSPLKASARVWKKRVDRIGGSLLTNVGDLDVRVVPESRPEDEPVSDKDEVFRTGQVVTGVEGMPYGIWRLIARISFETWVCEHIDGDPNIPRGQQQRLDIEGADLVPDVVEARLNALSDWIERVSTGLANQDERVVELELLQQDVEEHDRRIRRIPRPGPRD